MNKIYVGVTGYATSGKDEIGAVLREAHWFSRVAFADPVKKIAYMMGWDGKKDERGRRFLQDIGNRGRAYNEDVWVEKAFECAEGHERVVFTDVRFLNEARWIKNAGGVIVRVFRTGVGPANNDVSETEVDRIPYDYAVRNDSTLGHLKQEAERLGWLLTQPKTHATTIQTPTCAKAIEEIPGGKIADAGANPFSREQPHILIA